jgi:FKBP-type peptidyl-prolyl cis-trans isomerase
MKKIIAVFLLLLIAGCSQKSNVVTLKSGLKYVDDTLGTGREAKIGDFVTINFSGWKIEDSKNLYNDWDKDTSETKDLIGTTKYRHKPIQFTLDENTFIKGSYEGISGMKVGGTRTIIIPSNLAYGKKGFGPVPPNTDIKLQVSLVNAKEPVKEWVVDSTKIKTTKDGLKYVIIQEGTGRKAASGDIVTVNYSGYLLNGKKFDSSVERNAPITFKLGAHTVIPGWEEGIELMNKGAKAKFIIPPSLGYGSMAQGPIPPNSTLIFDVQLLNIK